MLVAMTLVAFVGTATSADLAVKADLGGISMTLGIGEMVEDYDYGVVIGGGVSFGKLAVEGRFSRGLRSTISEGGLSAGEEDGALDLKNQVIAVMVGYSL